MNTTNKLNDYIWTIRLIQWATDGTIKGMKDIGLEPMTHKEAITMCSKQMNPNDWLVCDTNTGLADALIWTQAVDVVYSKDQKLTVEKLAAFLNSKKAS